MAQYMCGPCGWIYDEDLGDPEHGLPAGTKFEDIPDDWKCPECGVGKEDFYLLDFVIYLVDLKRPSEISDGLCFIGGIKQPWFQPL